MPPSTSEVLRRHLGDPDSAFSIGAAGAIAEFMRDADEPLAGGDEIEPPTGGDPARLVVATGRGAIALDGIENAAPVAYETLSRNPERCGQGVVFCLPEGEGRRAGRTGLTELGPDRAAVLAAGRGLILFDLGVGAANVDFCVRTGDPELIAVLRAREGGSLFAEADARADDGALAEIAAADPQRVVISGLGRIEVTQPVGRTRTPEGPHTHLLPDLLAAGRTHGAETPLPAGFLPALHLYPPHPSIDLMGRDHPFDAARHAAFQALLAAWGPPGYAAEKARLAAAFEAGLAPEDFALADAGLGRLAVRVALRQMRWTRGESRRLVAWRARFDPPDRTG